MSGFHASWRLTAVPGALQGLPRHLLGADPQATDLTVDIGVNGSAAQRVGEAMNKLVNRNELRVRCSCH